MTENPFHKLFYDALSIKERQQQGIFFTSPTIVEQVIAKVNIEKVRTIVDTCAGAGDFLIPLAQQFPNKQFYGVEKNPLICTTIQQYLIDIGISNLQYYCGDILLDQFPIPHCDLYLGNPPFIHHSVLPESYRLELLPLWHKYCPEQKGFELLLGNSRSDIAQLIFHHSIEQYLAHDGQFAVILPNSLLKGQASRTFRMFKKIQVEHLTDIHEQNAFADTKRACFYIYGSKGGSTQYPLSYHRKNDTKQLLPIDKLLLAQEDQTVLGECHYTARQGVNTLGANAVFFFKQTPPFSSTLLHPLLKSSDIEFFHHRTSYWALLPYSSLGQPLSEQKLRDEHPQAYQYLLTHKTTLLARKSRFSKQCWYALFGIGAYTFAPYKVVWRGLGATTLQACVVHAAIPNQSMHCYFSTTNKEEAHYLCAVLNQPEYAQQLQALNEVGAKSFGQPNSIHRLNIPAYDATDSEHQILMRFSKHQHLIRQNQH